MIDDIVRIGPKARYRSSQHCWYRVIAVVASKVPKHVEAGSVIGGYELVRRIGRGGMAEVWVARKALGKKGSKFVAIKLIADHHVGDERYARMFRAEAELAAVLSHANIVQVFDEGQDEGRSYLVMEWVDGLNLLKLGDMLALLDDEQRRFRVIAYIMGQLLHALHYAHSITTHDGSPLGVVHRDVSPQNVLVSNHGEVKLTDFGVACNNAEESSGMHVKGKVRYMAPEQLSGHTRSPTVDLYAVGALLHELLDGKKFRGEFEDGQDLFSVVLSGHVSAITRPVPPELDRLRIGLLEPDASARIQSAEHAIALLKRYPGYGDARDELTELCGSLTGVVKPRVGPGQSGQIAAADQATSRWGGRTPLAKPKVDPRPSALGSPPRAAARPAAVPLRIAGAAAGGMAQGAIAGVAVSEALITGDTALVGPRLLQDLHMMPGEAIDEPVSTSAPTAPLQMAHLQAASPAAAQGSDSAHGVPVYVPGHPSHPILAQVPPAPPWNDSGLPPTQRLSTPEPSAAIVVGTGTDHDRVSRAAPSEATHAHGVARGAVPRSPSIGIVLTRRSMAAMIGVGLTIVAILSVSVTWALVSRGTEGPTSAAGLATPTAAELDAAAPPTAATGSTHASSPTTKPQRSSPEPLAEPPAEVLAPSPGTTPDAATEAPSALEEAAPAPAVEPEPEPDDAVQLEEPEPPRPIKKPSKPRPKAVVKIAGSNELSRGEVLLGSRVFSVSDTTEHELSAGKKAVKWRRAHGDPWLASGSWDFKPGKRFVVYVSKKGPLIRAVS